MFIYISFSLSQNGSRYCMKTKRVALFCFCVPLCVYPFFYFFTHVYFIIVSEQLSKHVNKLRILLLLFSSGFTFNVLKEK
jgi:hypothetical protein